MSERDTFDPTAPEGSSPAGNPYVTKKDFKVVIIGLAAILLLLYPVYRYLVKESQKTRCKTAMSSISKALNLYVEQHEGRYPPTFVVGNNGGPYLGEDRLPFTWLNDIQPYLPERTQLVCPAAAPEEIAYVEHRTIAGERQGVTYGFYPALSTYNVNLLENLDTQVVFAETSNFGSRDTYNPVPLIDESGEVIRNDGYVIGWSDSNRVPTPGTTAVTRLAFYNTAKGIFAVDGECRHDIGSFFFTASGSWLHLPPPAAEVIMRDGIPTGMWNVPATFMRGR